MSRIVGYDLARAIAIFGMVLVNFKVVMGASSAGPDWLVTLSGWVDGRAAAIFVTLAGIGVSLIAGAPGIGAAADRTARARRLLSRRAMFLLVVGLCLVPVWPADILHFYGVYIGLALCVLGAPTRRLLTLALGLTMGFMLLLLLFDYERGWDWSTLEYSGFWTPGGMLRHILFNGFHPVIPWLAFLLVGMAVGRQDLRQKSVRKRVFWTGASIAALAEAASRALSATLTRPGDPARIELVEALFGVAPMPPTLLYMFAAGGTACAMIAICVGLGERWHGTRWMKSLVSTGQLALTLYVAHVILGMGVLEALGRLEQQTLPFSLTAAAIFCVLSVVFASIWRTRFARGPLEAAMRALTDLR